MSEAHIKCIVGQLLDAVAFIHRRGFMHRYEVTPLSCTLYALYDSCLCPSPLSRDIKPDNILLTREGLLQLADFGHASRTFEPSDAAFPGVVTLWYRAPELLFRSPFHGQAVDMWAVGCVLGELLLRQPLFPGRHSEVDQLAQIFRLLGTPIDPGHEMRASAPPPVLSEDLSSAACEVIMDGIAAQPLLSHSIVSAPEQVDRSRHDPSWVGCSQLPGFAEFQACPAQPWRSIFPAASDAALDLLRCLLSYDPMRRLSAAEGRRHHWFTLEPLSCAPSELPLPPTR